MSLPGIPFSKNVYSASECQELCQKEQDCNNFVHDGRKGKNWCWLKTNANNQKSQEGATLGPKYCNGYNAPDDKYSEPDPTYQEPTPSVQVPDSNYEEPDSTYEEPAAIRPRGNTEGSDALRFPQPGA